MTETEKTRTIPKARVRYEGATYESTRAAWVRWNRKYYHTCQVKGGLMPLLSDYGFRLLAPVADIDVTDWDVGKATKVVMGEE